MIKFLFWELNEFINNKDELRSHLEDIYNLQNFFNQFSQLSNVANQHADILSQLNDASNQHANILNQLNDANNQHANVLNQLNNAANQHSNIINNISSQFSNFRSKSFKESGERKDDITFFIELMNYLTKTTNQNVNNINKHEERIANLETGDKAKVVEVVKQQNEKIARLEKLVAEVDSAAIQKQLDGVRREMEQERAARQAFEQELNNRVEAIQKNFAQQLQIKDRAIEQLYNQFEIAYKNLSEEKDKEIAALKQQINELKERVSNPEPPPDEPPIEEPKIFKFLLPPTDKVYISGTPEQITTKIKAAMNYDEIKKFLSKSSHPQRNIFLRNFEKHVGYLQKMLNKLKLADYDEEKISEEVTGKYFEVFWHTLLDNVAVSIYRGLDNSPEFYGEFLKLFNEYLQRCGLYTREVRPDVKVADADYDDMTPIPKVVQDEAQDKMILDVQQLPYYMNFYDEDGEVSKISHDGKMIIARFEKE